MEKVREFLRKNPVAGWAIVLVFVAAAGYLLASRLFGGAAPQAAPPAPAVARPQPTPAAPAAPPAALPAPSPAPAAPAPAPPPPPVASPSVVPPGPVGRADPFEPLVRDTVPGRTAPPPPAPGLPPPPFPTPGGRLPPPPLPGGGVESGAGLAVAGIVGNSQAVAIVVVGGRTEIVAAGDMVGELRVVRIDPGRRLVTFARGGQRFHVRMGGE